MKFITEGCALCGTKARIGDHTIMIGDRRFCGMGTCSRERAEEFLALLPEGVVVEKATHQLTVGSCVWIHDNTGEIIVRHEAYRDPRYINPIWDFGGDFLDALKIWIAQGKPLKPKNETWHLVVGRPGPKFPGEPVKVPETRLVRI